MWVGFVIPSRSRVSDRAKRTIENMVRLKDLAIAAWSLSAYLSMILDSRFREATVRIAPTASELRRALSKKNSAVRPCASLSILRRI
jgi:hypothetical protein